VEPELQINDLVILKKEHPCGNFEWKIVRLGADIGLVCTKCERKILLSRRDLHKRAKKIIHQTVENDIRDK